MKKRNPAVLTKEDWDDVEWWLKRSSGTKSMLCPWGTGVEQRSKKCLALFPKIKPRPQSKYACQHGCPCHSYNLKYVVRTAKQLLSQERG